MQIFKELPTLVETQEYEYSENWSDTNDADFEMKDDSVRKGFDQHELNNFTRDWGLSKKAWLEDKQKGTFSL